jgi:hypothetical protein
MERSRAAKDCRKALTASLAAGSFTNIETYDAERRRLEASRSERLNHRHVLFHVRLSVDSP